METSNIYSGRMVGRMVGRADYHAGGRAGGLRKQRHWWLSIPEVDI